jgi:hypothetical protein
MEDIKIDDTVPYHQFNVTFKNKNQKTLKQNIKGTIRY